MPKVFISYSWDSEAHKAWVKSLAKKLIGDGVNVKLDQWHLAPGDQLTEFMEREIRENDYVIIICTQKYRNRSNSRIGGTGYEGDIMTAEVLLKRNDKKFIPILREDKWEDSAPDWLRGKYYIDLRDEDFNNYNDLLTTLYNMREKAPPISSAPINKIIKYNEKNRNEKNNKQESKDIFMPIKILGVIVDEVGEPRNDGTRGSALYKIPFKLSETPPDLWARAFEKVWDSPPRFTLMHRPDIASVYRDKIILDGTTIEEVEQCHRNTLKIVVNRVNELVGKHIEEQVKIKEEENMRKEQHKKTVNDISKRINFD